MAKEQLKRVGTLYRYKPDTQEDIDRSLKGTKAGRHLQEIMADRKRRK